MGHPTQRSTTLESWLSFERLEKVEKGWRRSKEEKHQGKGRGREQRVESEREGVDPFIQKAKVPTTRVALVSASWNIEKSEKLDT